MDHSHKNVLVANHVHYRCSQNEVQLALRSVVLVALTWNKSLVVLSTSASVNWEIPFVILETRQLGFSMSPVSKTEN